MSVLQVEPHEVAGAGASAGALVDGTGVRPFQRHLLRALYLFIAIGLAMHVWPSVFRPDLLDDARVSVVPCMLFAFSVLCIIGIFRPVAMIPLLLWETIWKCVWLGTVALPLWQAGRLEGAALGTAQACILVVLVILATPWGHVLHSYFGISVGARRHRAEPSRAGK